MQGWWPGPTWEIDNKREAGASRVLVGLLRVGPRLAMDTIQIGRDTPIAE
jgi:hypothetical protein